MSRIHFEICLEISTSLSDSLARNFDNNIWLLFVHIFICIIIILINNNIIMLSHLIFDYSWVRFCRLSWLIFFFYIIIFLICWKRSINLFFHVMKYSFMILVSFLFMRISYVKRLVNLSKYFIVFEYNLMTFLIKLFRTIIMTINTFI